jgi:hypothetical protein
VVRHRLAAFFLCDRQARGRGRQAVSAQALQLSCRKGGKRSKFMPVREFSWDPGSVYHRLVCDLADAFLRQRWRMTWRHSRDHKSFLFPRELGHSAARRR